MQLKATDNNSYRYKVGYRTDLLSKNTALAPFNRTWNADNSGQIAFKGRLSDFKNHLRHICESIKKSKSIYDSAMRDQKRGKLESWTTNMITLNPPGSVELSVLKPFAGARRIASLLGNKPVETALSNILRAFNYKELLAKAQHTKSQAKPERSKIFARLREATAHLLSLH